MPPDPADCLQFELNSLKETLDKFLITQIEKHNNINCRNRRCIILPPTISALKKCFDDLFHSYVSELETEYPNITHPEITNNIDPWPIFVEYALRIYYSHLSLSTNLDEKLWLRLLLLVIFTLVQTYDSRYPFPNNATLTNYIAVMKNNSSMHLKNLSTDVKYLVGQIDANMP